MRPWRRPSRTFGVTEDLFDQAYLDTHAVGFDDEHLPEGIAKGSSFKAYILGEGRRWRSQDSRMGIGDLRCRAKGHPRTRTSVGHTSDFAVVHAGRCLPPRIRPRVHAHDGNAPAHAGTWQAGRSSVQGTCLSISGPYDAKNQVGPTGYADGGHERRHGPVAVPIPFPRRSPSRSSTTA